MQQYIALFRYSPILVTINEYQPTIIPSLQQNKGAYICPPTYIFYIPAYEVCQDGYLPGYDEWCGIYDDATDCNHYDYNNPACGTCRKYVAAEKEEILQRLHSQLNSLAEAEAVLADIILDNGTYINQ